MTAITAMSRPPPPTASVRATSPSKGVSRLKCDGTRRHACSVINETSSTHAPANRPSSQPRVRCPSWM
jgi:hypothetical protein